MPAAGRADQLPLSASGVGVRAALQSLDGLSWHLHFTGGSEWILSLRSPNPASLAVTEVIRCGRR